MQIEIEVKFLAIDHNEIRQKLQTLGAHLHQPMRLMRRTVFDVPGDGYLRVRDEGDRVTVTYKQFDGDTAAGAKEIETTVGDYDTMILLLQTLGHKAGSRQESKRETWQLDNCEVVLDEWPWLKPYIEIEGPSETELQEAAQKLGLDWKDAAYGSVTTAYRAEYNLPEKVSIGTLPVIAFADPIPDWLANLKRS